ncbi:MAG: PEGA domain-containing protein [Planctomycetes bacterium]|nr:PEGA domain-containing protein [Planctomycetota bacterium]
MKRCGRVLMLCGAGAMALGMGGCLERRIAITSEPTGAMVWLNDVEVGRTPCETAFTYFGDYDVRVRLEGYEPLVERKKARQPVYEYPPLDLVATAVPAKIETEIKWHFVLRKSLESTQDKDAFETDLIQRARELRGQVDRPGAEVGK